MKKLTSLLLALAMVLVLCACGGGDTATTATSDGDTSEAAYQAYLIEFVKSCQDITDAGSEQEYIDLINAGDYVTFPMEMLFNEQWFSPAAVSYDEFVAAGGDVEVVDHPSNGARMGDPTGEPSGEVPAE